MKSGNRVGDQQGKRIQEFRWNGVENMAQILKQKWDCKYNLEKRTKMDQAFTSGAL